MAAAPITIDLITCHLPSRPKLTWRMINDDENASIAYPTGGEIEVDGGWLEIPLAGPGECPVPLPPGTACADQGLDFTAHLSAVQAHGITRVKLFFASFDAYIFELPSTCGG